MAKNGEAVDAAGRPLLTQEEIDRLERYYGAVDPATKQVKIRRLSVPLSCGGYWEIYRPLWVWDWGRAEAPTEPQFRNLERKTGCTNNETLRGTLIDVFEQAKKRQNRVRRPDRAEDPDREKGRGDGRERAAAGPAETLVFGGWNR